ncbi:polysaccharide export outer membrane protein [Desulfacinum hydrothermale DSM 13146]|uniref:Polysaccharide export outer membrane protein n=1 Tax=Desulfacinum hydrothermale DSM 13146 TaxID=1121390 RepID=A0A1W1XS58_9BACT|nr:polysaccharide biosynthesis/export family protein [Desulfacinum hydrothermale]SMC26727.1 polysaccharide export outer membrane protein [Desulfacinum hydrothermale DSM 13146]
MTRRRMVGLWMLLTAVALWAACTPAGAQESAPAGDYLIAPGDTLEISVYGEPDLVRELVVRPDGKVSFPLVGDMEVAGKTTAQVKEMVERQVRPFIPSANATAIVTQLGSLQFYVIGRVNKPGMFNVSKPLSVLEALALAGGTTPFAKEDRILIIRGTGKNTTKIRFNLKDIKEGKHLGQNIVLERQDVVVVP